MTATCPADSFSSSGTACTDDGNVCTLDACNGSGACAHTPTADTDGDGLCDAIDPCTNTGGQFFVTPPKSLVLLSKINTDTLPNNDQVKIGGFFDLPAGKSFSDLHPDQHGARVVIEAVGGGEPVDATLATGAYSSTAGRGWRESGSGKSWTFLDKSGSPANGIGKVIIIDKSSPTAPRHVKILVTGKGGLYPVTEADSPIQAVVTLGNQADAAAGLCGESEFSAANCAFNAPKNQLGCRR